MPFIACQLDEDRETDQITPIFETFAEVRSELMSYRLRDYSGISIVEVVRAAMPFERVVARGNAIIGDWVGCEPSMAMAQDRIDWRGQWLGRRIHRERLEHLARVARRSAVEDPDGYYRRLEKIYSAGVEYGVPSVWVAVLGDYSPFEEADEVDEVHAVGPFAAQDEAWDALEKEEQNPEDHSVVPRLPYGLELANAVA